MSGVIDFAQYKRRRRRPAPSGANHAGSIHFEQLPDGTYVVTYRGSYARSAPLAAEHLADALLQLAIEIRGS